MFGMRYLGRMAGVAGLVLGLAGATSASLADIIYLTDGSWIKGRIVKESGDEYEVDGKTSSGIAYQGKLSKSRVRSITKSDDAPDAAKPGEKPATDKDAKPGETAKAKEPAGDFLVVPLKGTFGEEITPKGVDVALDWAVAKGVKHVVFEIDSPGGQVWAAERIRGIIKEHAGKVACHVVIQNAMSASIWVVFACDKIGALPGATLGAAVAFTRNETGNAQVDEKFNSAIAAKIATEADRLGHPGELARSMVLTDQKLYAVKEGEVWKFVHDQPGPDAKFDTLNEGNRVVTLTTEQMLKYGVASKVDVGDDAAIASLLGDSKFKAAGGMGESSMKNAANATKSLRKSIDGWVEQVMAAETLWQRALKEDDVNKAIEATDKYRSQLLRVGALKNSAKELGMLEYPAFAKIDVSEGVKIADENLIKLKELRRQRGGR